MKKKIANILNILIITFSLVWISGFYISFIAILANKVIPKFSIYNLLFWCVSMANYVVFIALILKHLKSNISRKLLRIIIAMIGFIVLMALIVSIFYFLKIY